MGRTCIYTLWEYDVNMTSQYYQDLRNCQKFYTVEKILISNVFANKSRNIFKYKSQSGELSET
ncbi:MAG: hypothetical protein K0S24_1190 [Sphingobacterium sp.]|jgi:hypothetical protein|nr:hypothetical protein [Sphingobacterium sp.]